MADDVDRAKDEPGRRWSGLRLRPGGGGEEPERPASLEGRHPAGGAPEGQPRWQRQETPLIVPGPVHPAAPADLGPRRPVALQPGNLRQPAATALAEAGIALPKRRVAPAAPTPIDGGRANPQIDLAKVRLHELLIEDLEHGALEGLPVDQQREFVRKAARELIAQEGIPVTGTTRDDLVEAVCDEVLGLGPLEPLLRDPQVSEVMVNDLDKIYFEQNGKIFRSAARFRDKQHITRIIERIVAPLGRRIDESSPMVDARLPDGSRVNITVPPASPKSATITIRKFRSDKMKMADLVKVGALSEATAEFLAMCVRSHLNIIVSGGTGTGKTTLLNALSAFIPNTERIVTIEDPAELKLQQEHVITLEARPPSIEGKNAIKQRDLVRNCLRMRPDRIIVGEVRGEECFDMLQAMNTGHDGSISTVHANNPRDAVARLENMVLMAGMDLPARAIREQIAAAIHVFIQVQRLQDGTRKVTHVTEVSGMESETVTLQDIFLFKISRVDADGSVHGDMQPTGIRPGFLSRFTMAGIDVPSDLFSAKGKEW